MEAVLDAQAGDLARRVEPRAEPLRLDRGPRREVLARDAVREADVVLDPRAGAGLPADGDRVERHGVEPLGRAVDRGGEAGRSGADDDEVEQVARRCRGT